MRSVILNRYFNEGKHNSLIKKMQSLFLSSFHYMKKTVKKFGINNDLDAAVSGNCVVR